MAPLVDLPTELLLCITENFESSSDVYALLRTSRRFYPLVLTHLYTLNVINGNGFAYSWLAKKGYEEAFRRMLEAQSKMPHQIRHQWRARMRFFKPSPHGHISDIQITTPNPLVSAVRQGFTGIVKLLLEDGVNPNYLGSGDVKLPIISACESGQLEMVKLLVKDCHSSFGAALEEAAKGGHVKIVSCLLSQTSEEGQRCLTRNQVDAALMAAILKGRLETVKLLLMADGTGSTLNNMRRWGRRTPLTLAAERGRLSIVQYLLDNGAKANSKDGKGNNALGLAVRKKRKEVVALLLEYGARRPA